jgi:hypothetical protein
MIRSPITNRRAATSPSISRSIASIIAKRTDTERDRLPAGLMLIIALVRISLAEGRYLAPALGEETHVAGSVWYPGGTSL